MGNFLDAPRIEKDSHASITKTGLKIGASGMQGWRLEMEDQHIAEDIKTIDGHTFLAVFDGHGGAGAANYSGKYMIQHLEATQSWKEIGRTEIIANNLNPIFITKILINYNFNEIEQLCFSIYDVDDSFQSSDSSLIDYKKQEFIGVYEILLPKLISNKIR